MLVATILPIVYILFFIWFVFQGVMAPIGTQFIDLDSFRIIFMFHLGVMAWSIALLIVYLLHLFKKSAVPENQRPIWVLVLLFGAQIGMLVYWFVHVWPAKNLSNSAVT